MFWFKGHCGVVQNYTLHQGSSDLAALSYTRSMPFYEGLTLQNYKVSEHGAIITHPVEVKSFGLLEQYYGLDNNLPQDEVDYKSIVYYESLYE